MLDLARSTKSAPFRVSGRAPGPVRCRYFFAPACHTWDKDEQVDAFHTPVLPQEVLASLAPALSDCAWLPGPAPLRRDCTIVDLTCGGGGHSSLMLQKFRPARQLIFDRDAQAIDHAQPKLLELAKQTQSRLVFHHGPFTELDRVLDDLSAQDPGWHRAHLMLADIGVSSHQLDHGPRGFSFRADAPLDMRMDPSQGTTAAQLIASSTPEALAKILRDFGQEPDAMRIAKALCATKPERTEQAAQLVTDAMSAVGRRKLGKRVHPATRTFQALRIAVNQELDQLDTLLEIAPARLAAGGRLGIISFHSLEDRRIKRRFRELTRVSQPPSKLPIAAKDLPAPPYRLPPTYGKGVDAGEDEVQANPRARSARLRVLEKTPDA